MSSGIYRIKSEEAFAPSFTFDADIGRFSFTFYSYGNFDTVKPEDGRAVATTDDGEHVFTFDVVDNNTIRFVQDKSDLTNTAEGRVAVL